MRPGSRLAVTLAVPFLLGVVGDNLLLPGVPGSIFDRGYSLSPFFDAGHSRAGVGVFALGILPICVGYWMVEVVAFLVPRWSRLRHGSPEGRAKLERASIVVALVLAAVQGLGMALSLDAAGNARGFPGAEFSVSIPLVVITLVGGVCIQFMAARWISRRGLLNGLVALLGAGFLRAFLVAVSTAATHEPPRKLALGALALVVAATATWAALRGAGSVPGGAGEEGDPRAPYRDARRLVMHPWIPVPSSSFQAYSVATSVLMLPAVLANFGLPFRGVVELLHDDTVFLPALFALTVVAMVVFARLMHRPKEMADLASRLGATEADKLRLQARAALRGTLLPSSLFFLTVMLASAASGVGDLTLVMLMPIVVDLVHALRSGARAPDLVTVWEERRASAVPLLRAALAGEGIDSETRGAAFLSFWQIFAPYAPVELLVKPADAERAARTLRHLFMGEERPKSVPSSEPVRLPNEPWSASRRTAVLGVMALLAGMALALTHVSSAAPRSGPRASLEIIRVDDSIDPFAATPESAIPEGLGVGIYKENVPLGAGRAKPTDYARVTLQNGETKAMAWARVQPWLATLKLPEGARFGFQEVTEYDSDTNRRTLIGIRSYVLSGAPVLTTNDVSDAVAVSSNEEDGLGTYVAVTLTTDAGKRFEAMTRQWTGRRMAIVVDGEIDSAPVIRTVISGGRVSITMGQANDPAQRLADAQRLASRLGP